MRILFLFLFLFLQFSFYGAGDPSRIFPQQNALLRVYMVVVGYAAPAVKFARHPVVSRT